MATKSARELDNQAFVLPAATIAGATFSAADSAARSPISNASTGETVGWQEHATAGQVDRAVHAAHDALIAWRHTTPAARGKLLRKIAELLEADRARLAAMQMQVSGKPPFEADLDVSDAIATFSYYAGLCEDATVFAAEPVALPDD